jgi:hypothetical protein
MNNDDVIQSEGMSEPQPSAALYCPLCGKAVEDPLVCGDCGSAICRLCGTPLESSDELAIG